MSQPTLIGSGSPIVWRMRAGHIWPFSIQLPDIVKRLGLFYGLAVSISEILQCLSLASFDE